MSTSPASRKKLKSRERGQRWREKMKSTAEGIEQLRKYEKEKYLRRKAEGKVLNIKSLPLQEQQEVRVKWKADRRRRREQKALTLEIQGCHQDAVTSPSNPTLASDHSHASVTRDNVGVSKDKKSKYSSSRCESEMITEEWLEDNPGSDGENLWVNNENQPSTVDEHSETRDSRQVETELWEHQLAGNSGEENNQSSQLRVSETGKETSIKAQDSQWDDGQLVENIRDKENEPLRNQILPGTRETISVQAQNLQWIEDFFVDDKSDNQQPKEQTFSEISETTSAGTQIHLHQNVRPIRQRVMKESVKLYLKTGGKRPKQKSNKKAATESSKHKLSLNLKKAAISDKIKKTTAKKKTCLSRQKLQGLSLKKKNESKVYRDNKILRQENEKLEKLVHSYQKKLRRIKLKNQDPSSPTQKVKKILNHRRVPKDIEDRLVNQVVLEETLQAAASSLNRHRDKEVMGRIMNNDLVRKSNKIGYMSKFASTRFMRGKKTSEAGTPINLEYKQSVRALESKEKKAQDVTEFLERDSSSRMTSGTKETITENKVKKQRRYLLKDMKELHTEFEETMGYSMSYSKFCSLRPFWVLFPSVDKRDTCACSKHENMALMLQKLHTEKVLEEKSSKVLMSKLTCSIEEENCMMRRCKECLEKPLPLLDYDSEKLVKYHQFETITEEIEEQIKKRNGVQEVVKRKVSRSVKSEFSCSIEDLLTNLTEKLPDYMRHTFYSNHQTSVLRGKRENLGDTEAYLWVDFAENYAGKMSRETQGIHFGASRKQFTLHTGVGYTKEEKKSYCTISENRKHGPPEIMTHLIPVVSKVLSKEPKDCIHFQSDSPTTQYRGREMFAYMTEVFPEVFPNVQSFTWNYTEAGHGKGPVDGVGAELKRLADKEVAHGQDVDTFEKFKNCLLQKSNAVQVQVVESEEFEKIKNLPVHPQKFPGTLNVHQLTWRRENPNLLHFNYLSCFTCSPGTKCNHFHLGTLNYTTDQLASEEHTVDEVQAPPTTDQDSSQQDSVSASETVIKKNTWVALTLSEQNYPGYVLSVRCNTASVSIMMREQGLFSWPKKKDVRKMPVNSLQKMLEDPKEVMPNLFQALF